MFVFVLVALFLPRSHAARGFRVTPPFPTYATHPLFLYATPFASVFRDKTRQSLALVHLYLD